MTRRTQTIVLGVLLAVLAGTAFNFYRTRYAPEEVTSQPVSLDARFTPLGVDNPALRLDILERFLALEYKGVHRSIFSATLPPPPAPPPSTQVVVAPVIPSGPPPLTVDAKYFGFVSDYGGSHRRAFFATTNNEDVIIAGEGDTFMGRFRVVRLTNTTADVEEVSTGRRATLTLEEPPTPNG
ncbi:MAG TPA: hypothetical protein VGP19_12080 [Candidatus Acidoferrales bacterium]|jgi:hypothetical protein|nr:hypothetical protein [Candidatus Acidoferrales bacterium]